MTQWKQINGFPYEVSECGLVRSWRGRVLKLRPNQRGHQRVTLRRDGMSKDMLVSRLVASSFVPNPDQLPCVRHKDFNRSNNAASNLEWCTSRDGVLRAAEGGRLDALVSPARAKRLSAIQAERIYAMRLSGKSFKTIAGALNVGIDAAVNVCHGLTWRHESRPALTRGKRRQPQEADKRGS